MMESVSVEDFVEDTLKDVESPHESDFGSKISSIRQTVYALDEGLDADRSLVAKSRKFVKGVVSAGLAYVDSMLALCDHLENLGKYAQSDSNNGSDLTAGFWKFSVIHRDLGNMFKHLMQNLNSILVFPMETFLQGDLKSDLKRPFEKSLKDYESKYEKLKKEKLQTMRETGVYSPETFAMEMADDLQKERRRLQLEVCEYFVKVNDVKAKKGSDLLQHFVDFYHAHLQYLRESVGVMEHFGKTLPDLAASIAGLQKEHDTQKRRLMDTRETVRRLIDKEPVASSGPQAVVAATSVSAMGVKRAYGRSKTGYLLKRADAKVLKRLWQRRRVCVGEDGAFCLFHADETKPPVRLSLLTCQLKLPPDPQQTNSTSSALSAAATTNDSEAGAPSGTKRSFFLVSNNRTYQFQAEDEREFEEWVNVLSNAMQAAFNQAMNDPNWQTGGGGGETSFDEGVSAAVPNEMVSSATYQHRSRRHSQGSVVSGSDGDLLESLHCGRTSPANSSMDSCNGATTAIDFAGLSGAQLHRSIQRVMRARVPGNRKCADCNRSDPEWVSVNLGVLICLECCGTHRELGVQCSRTQSLVMDDLSSAQLLLPRFIGNRLFNSVYEAALPSGVATKPTAADSDSASRRAYIRAKYLERKFVRHKCVEGQDLQKQLFNAIRSGDLRELIQAHADGADLTVGFEGESPLHAVIVAAASGNHNPSTSLAFAQFILLNAPSATGLLQVRNAAGETAVHCAARHGLCDILRLLVGVMCGSDGADTLPQTVLQATNNDGQTALDIVGIDLESNRCSELLRLTAEALALTSTSTNGAVSTATSSEQHQQQIGVIDSPAQIEAAKEARRALLVALDDLETVQWGGGLDSPPTDEDELSRTFRETLAGALKFDSSPPDSRDNHHVTRRCRTAAMGSNALSSALATLPRKKGPAPKPPSAPVNQNSSWYTSRPRNYHGRTLATTSTAFNRSSESPLHGDADHIEVLLDVLEEHPAPPLSLYSPPAGLQTPPPPPQSPPPGEEDTGKRCVQQQQPQRAIALYDCEAENPDELTFRRAEVIVVVKDVEVNWWLGYIEGDPSRSGLFPLTYVKLLPPST